MRTKTESRPLVITSEMSDRSSSKHKYVCKLCYTLVPIYITVLFNFSVHNQTEAEARHLLLYDYTILQALFEARKRDVESEDHMKQIGNY